MTTAQPHSADPIPAPASAARASGIDVSIIIVTWNSAPWVRGCLERIPAASAGLRYEVILVDNASDDESAALAMSGDNASTRVIRSDINLGFAGGVNRAKRESVGDFLFLLNPDCELAPASISTLVSYLRLHPEVSAAVPLLLDENGAPQREFQLRRLPTLRTLAAEALLVDKLFPGSLSWNRHRYADLDLEHAQPVEQPAAAAMIIRRGAADETGELDERFAPAWFEDVDYCRRLHEKNLAIHLVPEATAVHHVGSSLKTLSYPAFLQIWYRNLFRYAEKWFSRGELETLRWTLIGGMALRIAAVAVGLSDGSMKRTEAIATYWGVLRKAFDRWNDPSARS